MSGLNGDAVELDVRTLCDVLVERRLVENCVGAGSNVCTRANIASVDLGFATLDLGIHAEAGTRLTPRATGAAVVVGRRPVEVVVDQVVDLINIELVAVAHLLVDHVRHDHRAVSLEMAELNDGAAQPVRLQVKVEIHVYLDVYLVLD